MTIGWFPRFSPDGSRLTWERPGYWRAQFLTETTEIADNGFNLVVEGQPLWAPSCNELGAGGGVWAAWRPDPVRVFTSTGATIHGAGSPAVNPNGQIAYVDDRQGAVKNLIFDGRPVARGGITDVRCSRTALVWRDNGVVCGLRLDQASGALKIQVAPEEFGPVPIDTPSGPWVGCFTQTGIIVRPFGDTNGYRFDNGGQTYYPDWTYRDGLVVAVFTNDRGEQAMQSFDPQSPRLPLGATIDKQSGPVNTAAALKRAEITVDVFRLKPEHRLPDGPLIEFHDRENAIGTRARVWVEDGSARMSIDYPGAGPGLKGETAARRPVR